MRYYLNEKLLRGDITTNAETQRNPFIRIVPLFIKDLVVRQFYTKIQDKNSSAGLTNMGALKVPETMKPYIERFDIYMGQPFSTRTNCAIASFEDILTINFASSIAETDVERLFFRKLVQDGIHVKSVRCAILRSIIRKHRNRLRSRLLFRRKKVRWK